MKKVLLVCLFMWFCLVGTASGQWIIEDQTYLATANSHGFSFSSTGAGGDWAVAKGSGFSMGVTTTHGEGDTPEGVTSNGFANAANGTKTTAFSADFGQTSIAGAYAFNGGSASTGGSVVAPNTIRGDVSYYGGIDGDPGYYQKIHGSTAGTIKYFPNGHPQPQQNNEWLFLGSYQTGGDEGPVNDRVFSSAVIGGSVFQANKATEFGFSTGASAGNMSGGSFIAGNYAYDEGKHEASAGTGIAGSIETGGYSLASIDPTGAQKSATAMTGNFARINVSGSPDFFSGGVFGAGGAGVYVLTPDAYATGTAGFSYSGKTFGYGDAFLHSEVYDGGNFAISRSIGKVTVGAF